MLLKHEKYTNYKFIYRIYKAKNKFYTSNKIKPLSFKYTKICMLWTYTHAFFAKIVLLTKLSTIFIPNKDHYLILLLKMWISMKVYKLIFFVGTIIIIYHYKYTFLLNSIIKNIKILVNAHNWKYLKIIYQKPSQIKSEMYRLSLMSKHNHHYYVYHQLNIKWKWGKP